MSLPEFKVYMPAGSRCSDLPSSSLFIDAEKGSYTMNAHHNLRPTPNCRRCHDIEARLAALRAESADEMVRERLEKQKQNHLDEEWARKAATERSHDLSDLERMREECKAGEGKASTAEAALAQVRRELETETAAAERAARWQREALESSTELAEAEKQRDVAKKRVEDARRKANEAERQRRDLSKQAGTQEAQRLRAELETATKEHTDMQKKLRSVLPHVEHMKTEESRLEAMVLEETERQMENRETAKLENMELVKLRESTQRLRRSMQGQLDELKAEVKETRQARADAHSELTKDRRQRLDEDRRHRALVEDHQKAKADLRRLRSDLELTEATVAEQRRLLANEPAVSSSSGRVRVIPQRQPAMTTRTTIGAVSACAVGGQSYGAGGYVEGRAPIGEPQGSPWLETVTAVQAGSGKGLGGESGRSTHLVHATSASATTASAASDSCCFEDTPQSDDGDTLEVSAPAFVEEPPCLPRTVSSGNHDDDGSAGGAIAGETGSAGARLFQMIERAKERAQHRRLLSGAAEEVKAKARELEELL